MADFKIAKKYTNSLDYYTDLAKQTGRYDYKIGTDLDVGLAYSYWLADAQVNNKDLSVLDSVDTRYLSASDAFTKMQLATGDIKEDEFKSYFTGKNGETFDDYYDSVDDYFDYQAQRGLDKAIFDVMPTVEKIMNGIGYTLGSIGSAVGQTVEGLGDVLWAISRTAGGLLAGETIEEAWETGLNDIAGSWTGVASMVDDLENFRRTKVDFDDQGGVMKIVGDVATAMGQQVIRLIPYVGNALYWVAMSGNSLEDASNRYGADADFTLQILADAGVQIAGELLIEKGIGYTPGVGAALGKPGTKWYSRTLKAVASEGLEEFTTELLVPIAQKLIAREDVLEFVSSGEWINNALYAGLIGGITGGLLEGIRIAGVDLNSAGFNVMLKDGTKLTKSKVLALQEAMRDSTGQFKRYINNNTLHEIASKIGLSDEKIAEIMKSSEDLDKDITLSDGTKITAKQRQELKTASDNDAKITKKTIAALKGLSAIANKIGISNFKNAADLFAETEAELFHAARSWLEFSEDDGTYTADERIVASEYMISKKNKTKDSGSIQYIPLYGQQLTNRQKKFASTMKSAYGVTVIFGENYHADTGIRLPNNSPDTSLYETHRTKAGTQYVFVDANRFDGNDMQTNAKEFIALKMMSNVTSDIESVLNKTFNNQKGFKKWWDHKYRYKYKSDYRKATNQMLLDVINDPLACTALFMTDKQATKAVLRHLNAIKPTSNLEKQVKNNLTWTFRHNLLKSVPKRYRGSMVAELSNDPNLIKLIGGKFVDWNGLSEEQRKDFIDKAKAFWETVGVSDNDAKLKLEEAMSSDVASNNMFYWGMLTTDVTGDEAIRTEAADYIVTNFFNEQGKERVSNLDYIPHKEFIDVRNYKKEFIKSLASKYKNSLLFQALSKELYDQKGVVMMSTGHIVVPINIIEWIDVAALDEFCNSNWNKKPVSSIFKKEFFEKYPRAKEIFDNGFIYSIYVPNATYQGAYSPSKSTIEINTAKAVDVVRVASHEIIHFLMDKLQLSTTTSYKHMKAMVDTMPEDVLIDIMENQMPKPLGDVWGYANEVDKIIKYRNKLKYLLYHYDIEEMMTEQTGTKKNILKTNLFTENRNFTVTEKGFYGSGILSGVKYKMTPQTRAIFNMRLGRSSDYDKKSKSDIESSSGLNITPIKITEGSTITEDFLKTFGVQWVKKASAAKGTAKKILDDLKKEVSNKNLSDEEFLIEFFYKGNAFSDGFKAIFAEYMYNSAKNGLNIYVGNRVLSRYAANVFSDDSRLNKLSNVEVDFLLKHCFGVSDINITTKEDLKYWINIGFPMLSYLSTRKEYANVFDNLKTIDDVKTLLKGITSVEPDTPEYKQLKKEYLTLKNKENKTDDEKKQLKLVTEKIDKLFAKFNADFSVDVTILDLLSKLKESRNWLTPILGQNTEKGQIHLDRASIKKISNNIKTSASFVNPELTITNKDGETLNAADNIGTVDSQTEDINTYGVSETTSINDVIDQYIGQYKTLSSLKKDLIKVQSGEDLSDTNKIATMIKALIALSKYKNITSTDVYMALSNDLLSTDDGTVVDGIVNLVSKSITEKEQTTEEQLISQIALDTGFDIQNETQADLKHAYKQRIRKLSLEERDRLGIPASIEQAEDLPTTLNKINKALKDKQQAGPTTKQIAHEEAVRQRSEVVIEENNNKSPIEQEIQPDVIKEALDVLKNEKTPVEKQEQAQTAYTSYYKDFKSAEEVLSAIFLTTEGRSKYIQEHEYDGVLVELAGQKIIVFEADNATKVKELDDLTAIHQRTGMDLVDFIYSLIEQRNELSIDNHNGKWVTDIDTQRRVIDNLILYLYTRVHGQFIAANYMNLSEVNSAKFNRVIKYIAQIASEGGINLKSFREMRDKLPKTMQDAVEIFKEATTTVPASEIEKMVNKLKDELQKIYDDVRKNKEEHSKKLKSKADLEQKIQAIQEKISTLPKTPQNKELNELNSELAEAKAELQKIQEQIKAIDFESASDALNHIKNYLDQLNSEDPDARATAVAKANSEQAPEPIKEAAKKAKTKETVNDWIKKYGVSLPSIKNRSKLEALISRIERIRYISMLSSPSTWIRNIYVNMGMTGIENMTEWLQNWSLSRWAASRGLSWDDLKIEDQEIVYTDSDGKEHVLKITQPQFGWDKVRVEDSVIDFIGKNILTEEELNKLLGTSKYGEFKKAKADEKSLLEAVKANNENRFDKFLNKPGEFIEWILSASDSKFTKRMVVKVLGQLFQSNVDYISESVLTQMAVQQGFMSIEDSEFKDSQDYKTVQQWVSVIKTGQSQDSMDVASAYNNLLQACPKDIIEKFKDAAVKYTEVTYFKNDNILGKAMRKFQENHPYLYIPLTIFTPFARMSYNVMMTAIDYSPSGFVKFWNSKRTYKKLIEEVNNALETANLKEEEIQQIKEKLINAYNKVADKVLEETDDIGAKTDKYLKKIEKDASKKEQYDNLKAILAEYATALQQKAKILESRHDKLDNLTGFEQLDMQRQFAKATVGTCFWAVGILLAALGVLKIDYEEDYLGVHLDIGGWKLRLSDMSPVLSSMMLGTVTYLSIEELIKDPTWKGAEGAFAKIFNVFLEDSPFGFITDSIEYSDNVAELSANMASNYVLQFIPNILKQFSKIISPTKKVKSSDSMLRIWQNIADGLPFLRNVLEDKIDPLTGEPVMRADSQALTTIFDIIYTGIGIKMTYRNQAGARGETKRLGVESSGATGRFSFNGDDYVLYGSALTDFKKLRGSYIKSKLDKLLESSVYKNTSDNKKKDLIKKVYTKASEYAKEKWIRKNKKDLKKYKKAQ